MIAYFRPLRGAPRSATEYQEQVAMIEWARRLPKYRSMFAIPNASGLSGGYRRNARRVVALRRMGMVAGVPDLFLPVPVGRYHGLFVELKRVGGNVASEQKAMAKVLSDAGYAVAICFGSEQARAACESYMAGAYPWTV